MKLFLVGLLVAAASAAPANPLLKLNNGVEMPQLALGTWQYDNATAGDAIAKGIAAGFTHIDTAENYNNQVGVGKALAKYPRSSFFLTTKTLPCECDAVANPGCCKAQTQSDFEGDLEQLGVDYVDLILLHGASHRGAGKCDAKACAADAEQWQVYEDMYKKGKAKAIGVSNYCQSCFECLLGTATVVPAVNQIQVHVGMGDDPSGLLSYCAKKGIIVQAYSPLGDGKLIADTDLAAVGKAHGKSGAQVALKWLVDKGLAVVTKADTSQYLTEDIDLFSWNLTATETASLSSNAKYPSDPSWACSE
eukprot:g7434.t1